MFSRKKQTKMAESIQETLPKNAELIQFDYNSSHFGNMVVRIKANGVMHTFVTDRGEIYHNQKMLCDSSRYIEKEDTFPKLLQIIQKEFSQIPPNTK